MDINSVKKAVAKIKSGPFKKSNSISIGVLKSHFKGTGLQFKEHQIYVPGDEVRFIDWKLLAKTAHPYIKTFEEERNVEIVVVIDASATMLYGHNGVSKLQVAVELCCLLYLLAGETKDQVHCLIVTDTIINIPKKSGDIGVASLVSELQKIGLMNENGKIKVDFTCKRNSKNDVKLKEKLLGKHLNRKRELVILSDFFNFFSDDYIKRIIYNKNVHCYQILAPLDRDGGQPFVIPFENIINGKKLVGELSPGKEERLQKFLGKKIQKINVDESYLDKFIRNMI